MEHSKKQQKEEEARINTSSSSSYALFENTRTINQLQLQLEEHLNQNHQ